MKKESKKMWKVVPSKGNDSELWKYRGSLRNKGRMRFDDKNKRLANVISKIFHLNWRSFRNQERSRVGALVED